MTITIREERPEDEAAIHALTRRAFAGHPHSDGQEQAVIDRLRADGDLLLSLVAEDDAALVGQASYSMARLSNGDDGWWVIGPIAVEPAQQGKGIGRALMEAGEAALLARGAEGITVLGDPALYAKFGFRQHQPIHLKGPLADYLQVKSFGAPIPDAEIGYAPAFG